MATGASGLAAHTGSDLLLVLAVALCMLLVAAWVSVATRTAKGVVSGALLAAPATPATRFADVAEA